MSVEIDVAEWLEDQSIGLTTGTNLFLGNLFSTDKEGVCVLLNRHLQADGILSRAVIQILSYYKDYVVGRNIVEDVVNALDGYRGTEDETWAVTGEVRFSYIGTDQLNRNIFSISVEIAYKEA